MVGFHSTSTSNAHFLFILWNIQINIEHFNRWRWMLSKRLLVTDWRNIFSSKKKSINEEWKIKHTEYLLSAYNISFLCMRHFMLWYIYIYLNKTEREKTNAVQQFDLRWKMLWMFGAISIGWMSNKVLSSLDLREIHVPWARNKYQRNAEQNVLERKKIIAAAELPDLQSNRNYNKNAMAKSLPFYLLSTTGISIFR